MTEAEAEQLRQEREAFDLQKRQASSWFLLRLAMGYFGLALLALVATVCGFVLFDHTAFSASLSMKALVVLGGDLLAVLATTWKLVLSPSMTVTLLPITNAENGGL